MFRIETWEEYKRRDTERGMAILEDMPLREDYRRRIVERMEDTTFDRAVEETLREGRGDDDSDDALRRYTSDVKMMEIGKMWEEDASRMKRGEDPSSYLEDLVQERSESAIAVRDELRAAAERIFEAMGWMFSCPEDSRDILLETADALARIANLLEDMDFLKEDYSDVLF